MGSTQSTWGSFVSWFQTFNNMSEHEGKQHVSIAICGHVDSGKSTTTGRLIFDLGGVSEREMQKLREEAERLGKSSFAFAFFMDTQKEERERGVTIACQTKEFYTPKYHYTIIDAPGHKVFIKNMITGASQADVAVVMVPADGNFITSVAKGNHKEGVVQGQTRQHALLLKLLGIKQLIVCVNKMDEKQAGYRQERFTEIKTEMQRMLTQVGWTKAEVDKQIPIIPISGFKGDNLLNKTTNMDWWKGVDVLVGKEKIHIDTLHDALNNMVRIPERPLDKPFRLPVSHSLRSRVSVTLSAEELNKEFLNQEWKLNSCQLTPLLTLALVKFLPSKCITRTTNKLFLEITLVST